MIVDVLRGSKNERIMRLGFYKLSTYGISDLSEKRLRDIINHLVLNEYLFITNDEYPILKLGIRSNEILQSRIKVEVKLVKDVENAIKPKRKAIAVKPVSNKLFGQLSALRLEIANEQKVPAFVIFSDSTLTDMCMKLPKSQEQFLQISGVGQVKAERYGERFLRAIADFMHDNGHVNESKNETEQYKANDFTKIEISEEAVTVSVIADRINCILLQSGLEKLTGAKINNWLVSEGYLKVTTNEDGKNSKLPTELGREIDITSEKRIIRGQECFINFYGEAAQQLIVDKLYKIYITYNE